MLQDQAAWKTVMFKHLHTITNLTTFWNASFVPQVCTTCAKPCSRTLMMLTIV